MDDKTGQQLYKDLEQLEQKLLERKAALPAHSIRPYQLIEIEELEDSIAELKDVIKKNERTG